MKRFAAPALPLVFVVFAACSSNPADPGSDAGGGQDAAADATPDPNTPYEHAVLAATWTKLAKGPAVGGGAKQDDAFFIDAQTGWVASGPNWSIYKTTDGGDSWNKLFTSTGTYFRSIAFLDAMHGFAGNLGAGLDPQISDATVLYETTDGGTSWNPVTNITGPASSGICNLTVIDATHIVAVGRANGPSFMLSSSDAGASWTSIDLNAKFAMLIDARFTTPTDGILVGMNQAGYCSIQHTTDGGTTLDEVFASKTKNSLCWKISFPSDQVGYVSIQDTTAGPPTFAKTTDGGLSWAEMPMPGVPNKPFPAVGVGFITDNVGWMSPEDPTMQTYVTSDGGQTWTPDPALKSPINRFRFVDKNTAYAVGASVWKLSIPF
jgi:photosystem II stability/assembly factor-like uncharacterized protein